MESISPIAAIEEAASHIRDCWNCAPRVGIILGSGLGGFAEQIEVEATIPYGGIPHFPRSTAVGHRGQLLCGTLSGATVIAMEGRCHAYEGYTPAQITLPVRVMHALGIELLIVSNASGGMNPQYQRGDIVVIDDHINLMFNSPLVGPHHDAWGARFPDMSCPYDRALGDRALAIARRENFAAHRGVYVGVKGPNLETRAEYRLYRRIGGDVIGMSTVPEVIVAAQLGLRVLGLATVTNVCLPDALGRASGHEIIDAAAAAEPKLRRIVTGIVGEFAGLPKSRAALAIGEA
jgi:purine-nucleoside phosphorylase